MHRREKSAIQSHRREIVDDLFLEEDLLAKMMREKLFTTGMIEDIKSQKTMRDKTHRLLELLLKRGPDAFSKFCAILSEDYKWLAERLNETYKEKLADEEAEIVDSARTPRQLELSFPPTPRETFPKRLMSTTSSKRNVQDGYTRNSTTVFPETFGQTVDETDGQPGNLIEDRQTHFLEDFEIRQKADACVSPIQTLSPSRRYIHTASSPFPHTNYDVDDEDDSEEENTDDILHQVPNILNETDEADAQITGTEGSETTDNDNDVNETDEDKILEELFLKLYKINTENEIETEVHTEQEIGKVTLAMVHEEIDKLVKRVDNAETSLDQALDALGEPDTKINIDVHIQKLLEMKDELAQQLAKEKREKDIMVNDMYRFSLEMKHINTLKDKNAKFEKENRELREQNREFREQMEKAKLEGERKMTELQKRLGEVVERERTQAILQQQQSPQTVRRRTSKSFLSSTPRRTQPASVYQHSSFELFPPRSKLTYKKK